LALGLPDEHSAKLVLVRLAVTAGVDSFHDHISIAGGKFHAKMLEGEINTRG
jgi:hypothetical protein